MAQMQTNVLFGGPGFLGLNTEDSPLQQDTNWAAVANNR